jgi:hypothetical protein
LLRDLVPGEPVQELPQCLLPPASDGRAIVPFVMMELVAVAAVAVVAWFAAGTIWNVREASALMRWMQGGLRVLGERTTVRWLGSTAVEMVIRDAKLPFSSVTLVIFLEPRDLPWWLLSRLGGRRDTLIIRGVLRQSPAVAQVAEFEALDPESWSSRDALPRVPPEWQVRQATAPGGVVLHHPSANAPAHADALLALAQRTGLATRRLSVRRTEPNFQLHVPLPDRTNPARDFFEAVRTVAERALA